MSAHTATDLIEGYVVRLKAELALLGAAEADDLVAEIRSLLVEAADGDPDTAAAEIARIGDPTVLAAGILAEKGLSPASGMSTAEWWRMGIAVPLDIVIGLAVPVAVAAPAFMIATMAEPRLWATLMGIAVGLASVAWAWYVWQPWRTGGPRRSAGMVLTGLIVVRAPGFRKVVRSRDLAAMGMRTSAKDAVFGVFSLAVAAVFLGLFSMGAYQNAVDPLPSVVVDRSTAVYESAAGPEADQRQQVRQRLEQMYDSLVTFGVDEAGDRYVVGQTLGMYEALVKRAKAEKIVSYKVGELTKESTGIWKTFVTETTSRGTHRVDFVIAMRLEFRPTDPVTRFDCAPDWVIYEIKGDGLVDIP